MDSEGVGFNKPFRYSHPLANQKLEVKSCTRCHNGEGFLARNSLTKQNFMAIEFMLKNKIMPPLGFSLSEKDLTSIYDFINLPSL